MARKYQHRGYMSEGDREEPRKRRPKQRDTFRGRSEGRHKEEVFRCHECNHKIIGHDMVGKDEVCPNCKSDLHCCKNCKFFNPTARFECQKEIPKRIARKVKRNDCELFSPRIVLDLMSPKSQNTADDARKAFEDLFKK